MASRTTLVDAANAAGARVSEIPRKEAWRLLQAWREIYCARVHAATGKWTRAGISWHTFSDGHFPSLRGRRALDQYRAQEANGLLVLPEDDHETAIRCTSRAPVDFSGMGDIYIAPTSFAWTMVFTHEDPDYGPYFARSEGAIADGRMPDEV
jgi:hypothetical protein